MQIELDPTVNALYLRVRKGKVAQTVELEEQVYLDLDAEGEVLGTEFVDAGDFLALLERHKGKLDIPERMPLPVAS